MSIYQARTSNFDAAGETIFFARELEQIKNRVYEVAYAPLNASKLIPVDSTTDKGVSYVTYTEYDQQGNWKIIANFADDAPVVNVSGKQYNNIIVNIANAFIISDFDIEASDYAKKNYRERLANACGNSHRDAWNSLAFFGDPVAGVKGWLGYTNVDRSQVAATGTGATPTDQEMWINKTPMDIYNDVQEAIWAVYKNTASRIKVDTLAMPIAQFVIIQGMPMSIGSDLTVLEYILRNNPGVTIEVADELKGGFGGQDGMIAYAKQQSYFWQEIPDPIMFLEPQKQNYTWKINSRSRHGGTVIAVPESQAFRIGI